MRVAFDSNFLTFVFAPRAKAPLDPNTGKPVTQPRIRVMALLENLEKSRSRIVIPTPVLSEVLVLMGQEGPKLVHKLDKSSVFEIAPFDLKAAIELAQINQSLKKIYNRDENTWAKVKFDRQILSICQTTNVDIIFSDDSHGCNLATELGIKSKKVYELSLPEDDPQGDLLRN